MCFPFWSWDCFEISYLSYNGFFKSLVLRYRCIVAIFPLFTTHFYQCGSKDTCSQEYQFLENTSKSVIICFVMSKLLRTSKKQSLVQQKLFMGFFRISEVSSSELSSSSLGSSSLRTVKANFIKIWYPSRRKRSIIVSTQSKGKSMLKNEKNHLIAQISDIVLLW